ncbi:MAG: hypothetical protein GPJ54_11815 [Candidatus Heimdallarchaeota archaeon]|nr:hypothetical protein [Candidatus Heimdallarchaeota archaeon]
MGMFDTVEEDGNCWDCGAIIPSWQTKQLYSLMDVYKRGDRMPLHPNHKYLMIYSYCSGKKEYSKDSSVKVLWKGCGKANDAICILDEYLILQGIEVLSPTDERMKFTKWNSATKRVS